jgi:hypothetical protein
MSGRPREGFALLVIGIYTYAAALMLAAILIFGYWPGVLIGEAAGLASTPLIWLILARLDRR